MKSAVSRETATVSSCMAAVIPAIVPERRSSMKASACDDTEDARGQAYVMRDACHLQAGQAAHLRGLQNAAVACSQRWSHLPLHTPSYMLSHAVWPPAMIQVFSCNEHQSVLGCRLKICWRPASVAATAAAHVGLSHFLTQLINVNDVAAVAPT